MSLTMAHAAIRRVPTVYSLRQLDEDGGAGPTPKGLLPTPEQAVACLAGGGGMLPKFVCARPSAAKAKRYRSFGNLTELIDVSNGSPDKDSLLLDDMEAAPKGGGALAGSLPAHSLLDTVLLAEWEDRFEAGLFRYDVTACRTKVVPGPYGFIAQLNPGRAHKRATEFRIDAVDQTFDDNKFNFKKALQKEVLFQFDTAGRKVSFEASAPVSPDASLVFINVSPIEYGHVLLVPRCLAGLNQTVDASSLAVALAFAAEADNPYFRLGYNSLGAFGSVNHLHFQGYYLAAPFAVERAPTAAVPGYKRRRGGCVVSQLTEYPVAGLVVERGTNTAAVAALVGGMCQRLTAANVPHNLFIADSGARVFLYPNWFAQAKVEGRVSEEVLATMVDPAVFEMSGHILCKRAEDYGDLTQDQVWAMLAAASAPSPAVYQDFLAIALGPPDA